MNLVFYKDFSNKIVSFGDEDQKRYYYYYNYFNKGTISSNDIQKYVKNVLVDKEMANIKESNQKKYIEEKFDELIEIYKNQERFVIYDFVNQTKNEDYQKLLRIYDKEDNKENDKEKIKLITELGFYGRLNSTEKDNENNNNRLKTDIDKELVFKMIISSEKFIKTFEKNLGSNYFSRSTLIRVLRDLKKFSQNEKLDFEIFQSLKKILENKEEKIGTYINRISEALGEDEEIILNNNSNMDEAKKAFSNAFKKANVRKEITKFLVLYGFANGSVGVADGFDISKINDIIEKQINLNQTNQSLVKKNYLSNELNLILGQLMDQGSKINAYRLNRGKAETPILYFYQGCGEQLFETLKKSISSFDSDNDEKEYIFSLMHLGDVIVPIGIKEIKKMGIKFLINNKKIFEKEDNVDKLIVSLASQGNGQEAKGFLGELLAVLNLKKLGMKEVRQFGSINEFVQVNNKSINLRSSFSDVAGYNEIEKNGGKTKIGTGINIKNYLNQFIGKSYKTYNLYNNEDIDTSSDGIFKYIDQNELKDINTFLYYYNLDDDFKKGINESTIKKLIFKICADNISNFTRISSQGYLDGINYVKSNLFFQINNVIIPTSVMLKKTKEIFHNSRGNLNKYFLITLERFGETQPKRLYNFSNPDLDKYFIKPNDLKINANIQYYGLKIKKDSLNLF